LDDLVAVDRGVDGVRTVALSNGGFWLLNARLNVHPSGAPQTGPEVFHDTSAGLRARSASNVPTSSARPISMSLLANSCGMASNGAGL
jgi:hypothetical protein